MKPPAAAREPMNIAIALSLGLALTIVLVAVAVGAVVGGEDVPDGAIATVEGEEITREEFEAALVSAAADRGLQSPRSAGDEQHELLREEALGALLDAKWLEAEAAERGAEVSDAEVIAEFERTKADSFDTERQYRRFLRQSGQTEAEVHEQVRLRLISDEIQRQIPKRAAPVSDARVEERNRKRFADFISDYRDKWVSRTVCVEDLANERCSNGEPRTLLGRAGGRLARWLEARRTSATD